MTYWDCSLLKTTFYGPNGGGSSGITAATSSTVPTCPQKAEVQLHVNFPACWDGKRLDSFDHRSHMAYARGGQCPAGHPVALPALSLVYMYPARAVDAARVPRGPHRARALPPVVDGCGRARPPERRLTARPQNDQWFRSPADPWPPSPGGSTDDPDR